MTGLILRWRREHLQAGRQQRAQVQEVESLPCRGSGACIIVTIWPHELRSGHYDIEDKQQGTCACRQAAGRSTLALSLRMMEKYFDTQSKNLCRTDSSSRFAAIFAPGWNLARHQRTRFSSSGA